MRSVAKAVIGVFIALAVVVGVSVVIQAAVHTGNGQATTATPSPSATPDLAGQVTHLKRQLALLRHENAVLSRAIDSLSTPWISWTYEPSGDVPLKDGWGPMIYANIVAVHSAGKTISFDASQFFNGPPATAEQRREGLPVEDEWYPRNLYEHVQTMRVSSTCAIVGWSGAQVMTLRELAAAIKTGESPRNFWLFIDDRRITAMVGVYHP